MKTLQLFGVAEFAATIGMSQKKLYVYYLRGKLPAPFAMAGTRPFWTGDQVEQHMTQINRLTK